MAAELPFPISFEIPPGWTLVAPESSGHPEAAYVAVRNANASEPIATSFVVNGFANRGESRARVLNVHAPAGFDRRIAAD